MDKLFTMAAAMRRIELLEDALAAALLSLDEFVDNGLDQLTTDEIKQALDELWQVFHGQLTDEDDEDSQNHGA